MIDCQTESDYGESREKNTTLYIYIYIVMETRNITNKKIFKYTDLSKKGPEICYKKTV